MHAGSCADQLSSHRIDKAQTMEDKVSAVEKLLAKDEMLKP